MQAVALAEDFHGGELVVGRALEPLRQARRKGKGAAVLKIDDYPAGRTIIARRRGTRLARVSDPSPFKGGVERGIAQFSPGCPSIVPGTQQIGRAAWRERVGPDV